MQSVAVRLIVDREREIQAFVTTEYWNLTARLHPEGRPKEGFEAKLDRIGETKVEVGTIPDEAAASDLVARLESASYEVAAVGTRDSTRRPPAPHITSTLQRDASNRLKFRTLRTMAAAQTLYEGVTLSDGETVGLITYMRTDSTRVANEAAEAARQYIGETWGAKYAGPGSRGRAVKGAQDAHECIRPTGVQRTPDEVDELLRGRIRRRSEALPADLDALRRESDGGGEAQDSLRRDRGGRLPVQSQRHRGRVPWLHGADR